MLQTQRLVQHLLHERLDRRLAERIQHTNRQRANDLIRREMDAARRDGLAARLLVPLPAARRAALQFEVELGSLDQLERVRHSGSDPARTSPA